tara:strand:+ start:4628 stop:5008 length:381 start_codon:yes stop_codon:yes gene_type:complete
MEKTVSIFLFVVGVINCLPVLGVLSAARLSQAYAIEFDGNDLIILMRHRALLFGIVGGFILYSVFVPVYQTAAMVMAGVSMLGYVFLTWQVGDYNASLYKVLLVDIVGILCLAAAALLKWLSHTAA